MNTLSQFQRKKIENEKQLLIAEIEVRQEMNSTLKVKNILGESLSLLVKGVESKTDHLSSQSNPSPTLLNQSIHLTQNIRESVNLIKDIVQHLKSIK